MGNTIKFGVYSNPSKDADGKESYHVRHETNGTLNDQYIANHMALYNEPEASHIKGVVKALKRNIVEILTDNRNVHIEGLGNFYLKLGFRKRTDENGQEVRPHFTDPAKITGNDIVVEGIHFTADEEFLKELQRETIISRTARVGERWATPQKSPKKRSSGDWMRSSKPTTTSSAERWRVSSA